MTHAFLRPLLRHVALVLPVSVVLALVSASIALAGDRSDQRGFRQIAGEATSQFRHVAHSNRRAQSHRAQSHRGIEPIVIVFADDSADNSADNSIDSSEDFSSSFLREKAAIQRQRSRAKILHVSRKQFEIGESRAARREARMLENIDQLEFGYYRPNEAYDVRFPSVVYLDTIRK